MRNTNINNRTPFRFSWAQFPKTQLRINSSPTPRQEDIGGGLASTGSFQKEKSKRNSVGFEPRHAFGPHHGLRI